MGTDARMDLYLIRHGITKWNQEKRYLGHSDEPIAEERLDDLLAVKKEMNDIQFDEVWTSDLRRCQQTLLYLAPGSTFQMDERLREYHFGDWEGKTYDDLKDIQAYRLWLDDWHGNQVPGGESGKDYTGRVDRWREDFFGHASSKGIKNALVVTHGGVIRYLLSTLDNSKSFWDWRVDHGQGIHLTFIYREGSWKCRSLSVVPTQVKEKS